MEFSTEPVVLVVILFGISFWKIVFTIFLKTHWKAGTRSLKERRK